KSLIQGSVAATRFLIDVQLPHQGRTIAKYIESPAADPSLTGFLRSKPCLRELDRDSILSFSYRDRIGKVAEPLAPIELGIIGAAYRVRPSHGAPTLRKRIR